MSWDDSGTFEERAGPPYAPLLTASAAASAAARRPGRSSSQRHPQQAQAAMADTDALIQQALKEEEAERKRVKKEKAAHGAPCLSWPRVGSDRMLASDLCGLVGRSWCAVASIKEAAMLHFCG